MQLLISYIGTHNFLVNNKKTHHDGRTLILDVTINNANFVLINLYNANTESDVTLEKKLTLAGDFNLSLNLKLDAKGVKPAITKILS